jgi:hypothetical protein
VVSSREISSSGSFRSSPAVHGHPDNRLPNGFQIWIQLQDKGFTKSSLEAGNLHRTDYRAFGTHMASRRVSHVIELQHHSINPEVVGFF